MANLMARNSCGGAGRIIARVGQSPLELALFELGFGLQGLRQGGGRHFDDGTDACLVALFAASQRRVAELFQPLERTGRTGRDRVDQGPRPEGNQPEDGPRQYLCEIHSNLTLTAGHLKFAGFPPAGSQKRISNGRPASRLRS